MIRAGARIDAPRLEEIERESFPAEQCFSPRRIRGLLHNPRALVHVAERDGVVVGWVVSLVRSHQRWCTGRLYGIAVSPTMSGRGIGRMLVVRTLEELTRRGVVSVALEVQSNNERAIGLYRSFGFTQAAYLPDYYGAGVPGIRMLRESAASAASAVSR